MRDPQFTPSHCSSISAFARSNATRVSTKSELAGAIRYAIGRCPPLHRCIDDGRVKCDNDAAERALRALVLGRKNYLFAGSKLTTSLYLRDVLACVADDPSIATTSSLLEPVDR